jgi:hypothetical protein
VTRIQELLFEGGGGLCSNKEDYFNKFSTTGKEEDVHSNGTSLQHYAAGILSIFMYSSKVFK